MNPKEAVKEYQCHGCPCGIDLDSCNEYKENNGCENHHSRLERYLIDFFRPYIYKDFEEFKEKFKGYDKFNIPISKYVDNRGVLIVRGFMPRLNHPFIHIILGWKQEDFNGINCEHIREEDLEAMD